MSDTGVFASLQQDEKDLLIADGIMFMRTVTGIFGAEKGMEFWNTMADTIDPSLKQEIFMQMLVGNDGRRIWFHCDNRNRNISAVGVIKAIRTATGLGLKEAKDLWDESTMDWVSIGVANSEKARQLKSDLRKEGATIK